MISILLHLNNDLIENFDKVPQWCPNMLKSSETGILGTIGKDVSQKHSFHRTISIKVICSVAVFNVLFNFFFDVIFKVDHYPSLRLVIRTLVLVIEFMFDNENFFLLSTFLQTKVSFFLPHA